jgi:hypothetical protein
VPGPVPPSVNSSSVGVQKYMTVVGFRVYGLRFMGLKGYGFRFEVGEVVVG